MFDFQIVVVSSFLLPFALSGGSQQETNVASPGGDHFAPPARCKDQQQKRASYWLLDNFENARLETGFCS